MSMQTREGSSQDRAQHLGTKGGVTAIGASLLYRLGKTQLWARTSEALGPSGLFTTKRFHEIFIFNTDSLPNQGKLEQRETQVVTWPPKGDGLRGRPRSRVFRGQPPRELVDSMGSNKKWRKQVTQSHIPTGRSFTVSRPKPANIQQFVSHVLC